MHTYTHTCLHPHIHTHTHTHLGRNAFLEQVLLVDGDGVGVVTRPLLLLLAATLMLWVRWRVPVEPERVHLCASPGQGVRMCARVCARAHTLTYTHTHTLHTHRYTLLGLTVDSRVRARTQVLRLARACHLQDSRALGAHIVRHRARCLEGRFHVAAINLRRAGAITCGVSSSEAVHASFLRARTIRRLEARAGEIQTLRPGTP